MTLMGYNDLGKYLFYFVGTSYEMKMIRNKTQV